jgi:hypothetical protein
MVVRRNKETHMRNIDDIVSEANKAMAALLHEAFEAGAAHTVSELKSRMTAFFEGFAVAAEAHAATPDAHAAALEAPQPEPPQPDAPRAEAPQAETAQTEAPQPEAPHAEASQAEAA